MAETNQPANPFLEGEQPTNEPVTGAAKASSLPQSSLSGPETSAATAGSEVATDGQADRAGLSPTESLARQNLAKSDSSRVATERMLSKERPSRRRMYFQIGIGILTVLLVAGGVYWWWRQPAEPVAVAEPVSPSVSLPAPAVTEAAPPVLLDDSASYRSENFKAGEIVFLGEAEFLQTDEGIAPITLDGIRGEAFTEKNKQEVKLVITWNTNKLARGEVSYAKGIGQTPSIVETDDFAYDHSLILDGLDPATTYLYTIKAIDRFGNVVSSEPYAVFTGARSVSLFDLIAGAIGEVFGWAVK